ncbi:MAG: hypothetical protein F6K50_42580 [Moorea sp. SIO3I7]|nr:hypothetical protein [Moorena sp. SIO3I7]
MMASPPLTHPTQLPTLPKLPTLPTPYSLFPIPYSRFPIPDSLLPTPYSLSNHDQPTNNLSSWGKFT